MSSLETKASKPSAKTFGQRLRENFGLPPSKQESQMQIDAFLRANRKPKQGEHLATKSSFGRVSSDVARSTTTRPEDKRTTPFRNGLNLVWRERNH